MFGLGHWELLLLAAVILLLFGNRLPSVMRSLGRGVVEFKKGVSGIEDEVQKVGHEKDRDADRPANNGRDERREGAEHGHPDAAPK